MYFIFFLFKLGFNVLAYLFDYFSFIRFIVFSGPTAGTHSSVLVRRASF